MRPTNTVDEALAALNAVIDECRDLLLSRKASTAAWEKTCADGTTEWVTELDRLIEERISAFIRAHYPSAGLVGEEYNPNPAELNCEYCFVIDPIDGTRELLAGNDGFSISVSLLHRRRPVLGLLDFPARRQRFTSIRGSAASCNGEPIRVSCPSGRPLRVAVSPAQVKNPHWAVLAAGLEDISLIPSGALGSKLALVASGVYDAAFFLDWEGSRAPIWDFAAAGLILAGAGGRFTALDGTSLIEDLPDIQRGGWLATNTSCHESLLTRLQRYRLGAIESPA